MSLSKSTQLLEFILEKEKKERKKRQRRTLTIGGSLAGAILLGVGGMYIFNSGGSQSAAVYQMAALNSQKVEELLSTAPTGVRVEDETTGDTFLLRDVHQFAMLQAALIDDQSGMVNTAEWESGNVQTAQVEVMSDVVSPDRAREIRRRVASEGPLTEADIMPAFPGGEASLRRFLSKQLRYPTEASRTKTQGTVYLRFVIDENGAVTEPEVMRGIGHGCDEEAVRVVTQMPPWLPGEISGVKVPVYATLAINFRFL